MVRRRWRIHIHWYTRKNAILVGHYNDDARPMCRCGEIRSYR